MISRGIPSLDPELQAQFSLIIQNKTFNQNKTDVSWETDILPKLLTRLDQLVRLSKSQESEETTDTIKSIETNSEKIKNHLMYNFTKSPPFTITRIAEVINDPEKEGYSISDNIKLVKYFNSLKKLTVVSSSIDDFPQVDISEVESDEKNESVIKVVGQSATTIPLTEIPWLNQADTSEENKELTETNSEGTSETNIEAIINSESEDQQSKKRNIVEHIQDNDEQSKRSKIESEL